MNVVVVLCCYCYWNVKYWANSWPGDMDYWGTTLLFIFMWRIFYHELPFRSSSSTGRGFYILNAWNLGALRTRNFLHHLKQCLTSTRTHLKVKKYGKHSSLAAHSSPSPEVLHTPIVRYGLLCSVAALTTAPSTAFAKVLVPCFEHVSAHANTACTSEKRYWHTYFITPLQML